MRKHPRRTLLGGIGSTVAIAAAGCLSFADDTDESPADDTDDTDDTDDEFDVLLEYVPDSVGDNVALSTADFARLDDVTAPNGYGTAYGFAVTALHQWNGDIGAISNGVVVERINEFEMPLTVLELENGDFDALDLDPDVSLESREHHSGLKYERGSPDTEDEAIAVIDDIVVIGESEDILDDALDATAGDTARLLEERPAIDAGLEYFAAADSNGVTTDGESAFEFGADPDDLEYLAYATTVVDSKTIEFTYGVALESESLVTDDLLAAFEDEFTDFSPQHGSGITVEADGAVMTANWTIDLEAQRRASEHNSPSGLRIDSVDPESEYVNVRITHADPTPVDELTLEIDDEPYDEAIWADGQTELEEGDTIRLETDRLEPNLPVTITHETDHFTSSMTTTIFGHFRFEFEHDLETGTMTVQYEDKYSLDGDDIILAVHEADSQYGDASDPVRTATPWEGTTLSAGDETTLEEVNPGMTVLVGWQGTSFSDAISRTTVRPPGMAHTDYEYETNTLSVELVFEDDRTEPADAYELLIGDEPAPTQWSDGAETVTDGSTVVLEDVEVGAHVTVTWGDGVYVGGGSAMPALDVAADLENGDLILTHESGPALSVSDLSANIFPTTEYDTVAFDSVADGTFSEGDTVTLLEDIETDRSSLSLSVQYDGHWITSAHPQE